MPPIHVQHRHALAPDQARAKVENIAEELAQRYGATCRWHGDSLHFQRSGLEGCLELAPQEVTVHARLGLMLRPMHKQLTAQVEALLRQHFPTA